MSAVDVLFNNAGVMSTDVVSGDMARFTLATTLPQGHDMTSLTHALASHPQRLDGARRA